MAWSGYVYVYSPLTAYMIARTCYCSSNCASCSGTHSSGFSALGFCCPVDVGGGGTPSGTNVKFYASAEIGSIETQRQTGFCLANPPAPYEDAVIVYLYRYANAECFIGKLFYGHLSNRVSNGIYNRTQYQGMTIGKTLACCQDCYGGVHTHMGRDTVGATQAYSCCANLTQGSSWIYRWYWQDGPCPAIPLPGNGKK